MLMMLSVEIVMVSPVVVGVGGSRVLAATDSRGLARQHQCRMGTKQGGGGRASGMRTIIFSSVGGRNNVWRSKQK